LLFAIFAAAIFLDYVLAKNIIVFKTYFFITLGLIVFVSLPHVFYIYFKCKGKITAYVLLWLDILFAVCHAAQSGYGFYSVVVSGNFFEILHNMGDVVDLGSYFALLCAFNMIYPMCIIGLCGPEIKSQCNLMI
jgi:hypothetical protein